jgi:histidine ammonia-lyase
VQATVEPFDSAHFDVARPLKGCVQSAQQLRALLEGSRNTNDTKRVAQDAEAIRCIPQMHGPAREAVDVRLVLLCVKDCVNMAYFEFFYSCSRSPALSPLT